MASPKITILLSFPLDFQEQFDHVKARGEPLSRYIRGLVLADRENELSRITSEGPVCSKEMYYTVIQEAIKNNLPGFRGGFISSIMLNRSGLLKSLSRDEQKEVLSDLGYKIYTPIIRNQILPDYGCPRLYIHKDAEVGQSTGVVEVAKRYTQANCPEGVFYKTPKQIINRIKKAICDNRPGFAGGFLSRKLVGEFLQCELNEKEICARLGYHQHPDVEDLLVKDGNLDESFEHYIQTNTFVSHTKPLASIDDLPTRYMR